MRGEPKAIKAKLKQLVKSPMLRFPATGDRLAIPHLHGVYIIYDSKGRVAHVGRTIKGKRGLHQRINNHLHGKSSFVAKAVLLPLKQYGRAASGGDEPQRNAESAERGEAAVCRHNPGIRGLAYPAHPTRFEPVTVDKGLLAFLATAVQSKS